MFCPNFPIGELCSDLRWLLLGNINTKNRFELACSEVTNKRGLLWKDIVDFHTK